MRVVILDFENNDELQKDRCKILEQALKDIGMQTTAIELDIHQLEKFYEPSLRESLERQIKRIQWIINENLIREVHPQERVGDGLGDSCERGDTSAIILGVPNIVDETCQYCGHVTKAGEHHSHPCAADGDYISDTSAVELVRKLQDSHWLMMDCTKKTHQTLDLSLHDALNKEAEQWLKKVGE